MKKTITFLFLIFLAPFTSLMAQFPSGMCFNFDVSSTPIPSFPIGFANIIPPTSDQDEGVFLLSNIPNWSIDFAGSTYGSVAISTNGWLALLPDTTTVIPASILPFPNNDLSNNSTGYPIVAPLWDDLSTIIMSWVVPSGSNELWVRWSSKWDNSNSASGTPITYIKLDGNNNSISYYYSNYPAYIPTNPSASIGIAGGVTGEFYSVSATASNNAYADSVNENTDIGMGGPTTMRPYNTTFVFSQCLVSGIDEAHPIAFNAFVAGGKLRLNLLSRQDGPGSLQLFDITGKLARKESVLVSSGKSQLQMDVSGLRSGIYFLVVAVNDVRLTKRIVLE